MFGDGASGALLGLDEIVKHESSLRRPKHKPIQLQSLDFYQRSPKHILEKRKSL
jgi:hypothetical protein